MATKSQRLAERERQIREKALELRRKNYKSPAWTSEIPRPDVDPTIWDDPETNDRLATYIDWHRRHPHAVTPRARGEVLVVAGKDIQVASPRTQVELMRGEDTNQAQQSREAVFGPSPTRHKEVSDTSPGKSSPSESPARDASPSKTPPKDSSQAAGSPSMVGSTGGKTNVVSPDKNDGEKSKKEVPKGDPMAAASFIRPKLNSEDELVYYGNGIKLSELSPEFKAPRIGANGRIAQVTKLAAKFQREASNIARYDNNDPWYKMSVKDGLETYHIDGDHTSVRLKPPKARQKSAEQIAFEEEMKWKEEQYGRYKGGGPSLSEEQQIILEKLAVNVPTDKEKKIVQGPWEDPHKWSKYTEEGTLLDDFNSVDLERKIKEALVAHEELIEADRKRQAKLKKERLLAKKATRERNSVLGLSGPTSRPQSSRIHPMGRVPEGDEESVSLMSQDIDNATAMTEMTFDNTAITGGGTAAGSYEGSGVHSQNVSSQAASGLGLGGSSVGSGSTYRHKAHGQSSVGPLSIGTGASQAPPYKGGLPVPEAVIQDALQFVDFREGEGDGTTIDGSLAGQSSVSNLHDDVKSLGQESKDAGTFGASEISIDGSLGSPSVNSSVIPTTESASDKKKRKMKNVLAAKGLSSGKNGDDKDGDTTSVSSNTFSSMFSTFKVPKIPDLGIMKRIRGPKEVEIEENLKNSTGKKKRKLKTSVEERDGNPEGSEENKLDDMSDDSSDESEADFKDKYDVMREQLGGDEKLEAASEEWLKFAAYVRKKAKRDTNLFDTSMDLPDAVDKSNLSKTVFMLAINGADPNMKANNEEPLIINVVNKILLQDNITGSLETNENETGDRVRAFRVLQALVKYKVELNTREAKNGVPPLHLAVAAGNFKMIRYLIESGADPNYFASDDTTALMNAAKYGHIKLMSYLLRHGALLKIKDKEGRNVLHHAGKWGQTRSALFLLRCGIDKRIKDNEKLTPGALAEREGHIVTGQAIMTFAVAPYKAQFALQYFIDQKNKENEPKSMMENAAANISNAMNNAGKAAANAVSNAFTAVGNAMGRAGSAVMGFFGMKKEEKPTLDPFDA